jgi:hypothetical protein
VIIGSLRATGLFHMFKRRGYDRSDRYPAIADTARYKGPVAGRRLKDHILGGWRRPKLRTLPLDC